VLTNDGITTINSGDSPTANELVANFQDGIASNYRSPPSVALGASYGCGSTTVYATAEWFAGVDEYTILDAGEFLGQTTGDTLSNDLIYRLKHVLDFGFGLEHRLNDRFQAYGAFFSDRSALPDGRDRDIPVALADWDIWHLSAGGAFVLGNIDITLGASYGWGTDAIRKPIEVPGDSPVAELDYRSIKLIFGFGVVY
jgi:long-subunit fatty acid transport protein